MTRRHFLGLAAAGLAAPGEALGWRPAPPPSLGICLYGMGRAPLEETLRDCARIGYENVEIMLAPGYPTDPKALSPAGRKELRRRLDSLRLGTSALLLRDLRLGADGAAHAENLETIREGAGMSRDLDPEKPPHLEAIMGGKPADWEKEQKKLGDRLGDWARAAEAGGVRLAVKAHAGQAVDTPEKLLWLLHHVGSPALAVDFDYSHFEPSGISLTDSLTALLPYVILIQAKDSRVDNGKVRYLIPGEGDIDYRAYFHLLKKLRYAGPVVVEISKQVFTRPGFSFHSAAAQSFATLHTARDAVY